jgi:carbon storage regulator CsrA
MRRPKERIVIDDRYVVSVVRLEGLHAAVLAIDGPRGVTVHREEIYLRDLDRPRPIPPEQPVPAGFTTFADYYLTKPAGSGLQLTRYENERIVIADDILLTITGRDRNRVKLGVLAREHVRIYREEIYHETRGKR